MFLRLLQQEQVQLEQELTVSHALLAGLSKALVAGEAELVSAFRQVPLTHCAHPSTLPGHIGTGCQMNFLMKTHSQEETLETNAQRYRMACSLLSDLLSDFSSAIKVFGLVLHRASVGLFSQRSSYDLEKPNQLALPSVTVGGTLHAGKRQLCFNVYATHPFAYMPGSSEGHCALQKDFRHSADAFLHSQL